MRRNDGQKIWTATMISKAADIAAAKGVSIKLFPDGSVEIMPGVSPVTVPEPSRKGKMWDYEDQNAPPYPISPRFDRREYQVMEQLAAAGVGKPVHHKQLKQLGPTVQTKLQMRGYIDTPPGDGPINELQDVVLTRAGMDAWKALQAYNEKYKYL